MRRHAVTRVTRAKALTEPSPSFVSLVRAGANQEPLRVIKTDNAAEIAEVFSAFDRETSMSTARKKARKAGMDIAMLVFKGDNFKDETTVKKWLDDGGYDGYEIVSKSDSSGTYFEVTSELEFETGTIKKVKGNVDGLTVFVGAVKGGIAPEPDEEAVVEQKTEQKPSVVTSADPAATEQVTKEDETEGSQKSDDASETIRKKADDLVAELRAKSMYDVSNLGSTINTLRWMVYDAEYGDLPEDAVSAIKAAAMSLIDALVIAANSAIADMVEVFTSETATMGDKTGDTEKTDTTKSDATATDPEKDEEAGKACAPGKKKKDDEAPSAVVDALKAMSESVTKLSETVSGLATSVKDQGSQLGELTSRVSKAEEAMDKGQTRKGADATEPVSQTAEDTKITTEKTAATKDAERRMRSALGSYRGVNAFGNV